MLIGCPLLLTGLALPATEAATPAPEPAAPVVLPAAPAWLQAGTYPLPYDYLEARYVKSKRDGFDKDPEGFEFNLSKDMGGTWFLFTSVGFLEGEALNSDVDIDSLEIGLGLHTRAAQNVDLVIAASWIEIDADAAAPGSSNDDGYNLRGGLRFALGPQFEVG